MVTLSPQPWPSRIPAVIVLLAILLGGCGPTEETFEGEEWDSASPASAKPQATEASPGVAQAHRADSLMRVNMVLQGQIDALTAENRTMRGRIAELETELREVQKPAPVTAPTTASTTARATAPSTVATTPAAAPARPSSDLKASYSEALDQFMGRNYQAAIQQFDAILQSNAGTDLADNCTYWIGESYYALHNYGEATRQFERVLEFPSSGKKPYAQLMIGNAQLALGNRDAARDAYNTLVSSYPSSPLVPKAQAKLARLR